MAKKDLLIAGSEWNGIDKLHIPTTDNQTATFIETSEATAKPTDIIANQIAYGDGIEIKGEMPELDIEQEKPVKPWSAYLKYKEGKQLGSEQWMIFAGELSFDLAKVDEFLNEKQAASPSEQYTLTEEGINFITKNGTSCSGIRFYHPGPHSTEETKALQFLCGTDWETAAQWSSSGWYWNGEKFPGGANPITIQADHKTTNEDFYNAIIATATLSTGQLTAYVAFEQNVYIAQAKIDNDTLKSTGVFEFAGMSNLTPDKVLFGTEITGIRDSNGETFMGTLKAAVVTDNNDGSLTIE